MKKTILLSGFIFTLCTGGNEVVHAQDTQKSLGHVPAGFQVLLTPKRSSYYLANRSDDTIAGVKMIGKAYHISANGEGLELKNPDNEGAEVFAINIKDKAFRVPQYMEGKEVAVYGTLIKSLQSVEEQKQYLAGSGASKAAIDAVKEPRTIYRFVADGIEIQ